MVNYDGQRGWEDRGMSQPSQPKPQQPSQPQQMSHHNLLGEPAPTLLPDEAAPREVPFAKTGSPPVWSESGA